LPGRSHQRRDQTLIEAKEMLNAIPISRKLLRAIKPVYRRVESVMRLLERYWHHIRIV
jgi:hypothetical protein